MPHARPVPHAVAICVHMYAVRLVRHLSLSLSLSLALSLPSLLCACLHVCVAYANVRAWRLLANDCACCC